MAFGDASHGWWSRLLERGGEGRKSTDVKFSEGWLVRLAGW